MQNVISIEELADEFELLIFEQGDTTYKITKKCGRKVKLEVKNLQIDIEDDYICFYDEDNILLHDNYFNALIIKSTLLSIHKIINKKTITYRLDFNNYRILIRMTR
jgi:hypothetical protein